MKGKAVLPRKVRNVSNQRRKSYTLRKRDEFKLLEEISVVTLYNGGVRIVFHLKKGIIDLISI